MSVIRLKPDHHFEVSWEVCNKVGGIHTVLSTKAGLMQAEWGDRQVMIGPDLHTGTGSNPEFAEDKEVFAGLKAHMQQEGLPVRTGRWNIPGSPLVILIDFTPLFQQKNTILGDLWTKFHVDSLTGQWDYIEPAIFGYAAARLIHCFYQHYLNATDKILAHFHEWMTGAGVLYLEEHVPQIATVFTTHATVLGRTIAGNGQPFYSRFDTFDPDRAAREYKVVAKHSLEKTAAAMADCFTCVSDLTGRECEKFLGKHPDFITPNGFDASFVPDAVQFPVRRAAARKKVMEAAAALTRQPVPENSLLVIKSGRYEFRNKGIDVFIDGLAKLNEGELPAKHILAVIFVPAHHTGPRKVLEDQLLHPDYSHPAIGEVLTHNLLGADTDPILNRIRQCRLDNHPGSAVTLMFVPTYLDGNDGIFNMSYYDILIGFDLAIFPSYYEPWGYTPMESLAFHIPAVTTTVSGFGIAVAHSSAFTGKGIYVIDRNDDNERKVGQDIAGIIREVAAQTPEEELQHRDAAAEISRAFLWPQLFYRYQLAYDFALQKSLQREALFRTKPQVEPLPVLQAKQEERAIWRSIHIQPELPANLQALKRIGHNFWWSWNPEAVALFTDMDPVGWEKSGHNPIQLLDNIAFPALQQLANDDRFLNRLTAVAKAYDGYMDTARTNAPLAAYFCMEYGISGCLKQYAGGLGILAGDYLKAASDQNRNLVAVGLFYRQGYFRQKLSQQGEQVAVAEMQEPEGLPLSQVRDTAGNILLIPLAFPGRTIHAAVWKADVGRIPLYLLDTNVENNQPEDRLISAQLYGGDPEMRLKQEIVLGIGGVRMLTQLGVRPDIYHINEGHAAFTGFERINAIMHTSHLSFDAALEIVKATTLFTTHTSVKAAMDLFSEELLRAYLSYLARDFNVGWGRLMGLGKLNASDREEQFSMFYLAARLSGEINAVSELHRKVSGRLLNPLWKDFRPEELHIGCVKNGVHVPTWMHRQWQGTGWYDPQQRTVGSITDDMIWSVRKSLKKQLTVMIRNRWKRNAEVKPGAVMAQPVRLDEHALFIGFARRAAPYKRADLLFSDLQRLAAIVNRKDRPVRIIVAGKAHPRDEAGGVILKTIIAASRHPELKDKVLFLEDYDMELAAGMVQGVDLWLNTPLPGKEASGTSGMKAAMNGVLHCSTEDGWWADVAEGSGGWTPKSDNIYDNAGVQDREDATVLYNMLENEIIPLFFDRNEAGIPLGWTGRISAAFTAITPAYDMNRVVEDYDQYYRKLHMRHVRLQEGEYEIPEALSAWKKKMIAVWKQIHVMSIEQPVADHLVEGPGELFVAKIVLYTGELTTEDIRLEVVFAAKDQEDGYALVRELTVTEVSGSRATFECRLPLPLSGSYTYSFRVMPRHPDLAYPQELPLIKWI